MMNSNCHMLNTRYQMLNTNYQILNTKCQRLNTKCQMLNTRIPHAVPLQGGVPASCRGVLIPKLAQYEDLGQLGQDKPAS